MLILLWRQHQHYVTATTSAGVVPQAVAARQVDHHRFGASDAQVVAHAERVVAYRRLTRDQVESMTDRTWREFRQIIDRIMAEEALALDLSSQQPIEVALRQRLVVDLLLGSDLGLVIRTTRE